MSTTSAKRSASASLQQLRRRQRPRRDPAFRLSESEDPVSLQRFPRAFAVTTDKQTYNARSLDTFWRADKSGRKLVPHTMQPASPATQSSVARAMAMPEAQRWAARRARRQPELTPVNWSRNGLPIDWSRSRLPEADLGPAALEQLGHAARLFFRRVAQKQTANRTRSFGPFEVRPVNGGIELAENGVGVVLFHRAARDSIDYELYPVLSSAGRRVVRESRDAMYRKYRVRGHDFFSTFGFAETLA